MASEARQPQAAPGGLLGVAWRALLDHALKFALNFWISRASISAAISSAERVRLLISLDFMADWLLVVAISGGRHGICGRCSGLLVAGGLRRCLTTLLPIDVIDIEVKYRQQFLRQFHALQQRLLVGLCPVKRF